MVLQIALTRIYQESELNHMILYLLKKYFFLNVIILIKSVVNKKKNECYHNIFLETGSNVNKCNTEYF